MGSEEREQCFCTFAASPHGHQQIRRPCSQLGLEFLGSRCAMKCSTLDPTLPQVCQVAQCSSDSPSKPTSCVATRLRSLALTFLRLDGRSRLIKVKSSNSSYITPTPRLYVKVAVNLCSPLAAQVGAEGGRGKL